MAMINSGGNTANNKEKITTSFLLTELVSANPEVMVIPLTVEEAKLIRSSFMRIADRLEEIGTSSFSELFTHHPEAVRVFVTNRVFPETITEVAYSWELKGHAMRVMHTFEKIINRLDKPATIWSAMISDIGCRHAAYNAKPAYLPVLIAAFRHAFFKEFTKAGILTPELSNVWYKLFNNMTVLMTAAVVASFVDSYAEYKQNPAVLPVWLAASSPSRDSSKLPSPGDCPVKAANGKPKHQGSGVEISNNSNNQNNIKRHSVDTEKEKCPHRAHSQIKGFSSLSESNEAPPLSEQPEHHKGSSSRMKDRLTDFLLFQPKHSSKNNKCPERTSNNNNNSQSLSRSSSNDDDVQIINI